LEQTPKEKKILSNNKDVIRRYTTLL